MTVRRLLVSFGRFWWDFIVGDTPEIAAGVACLMVVGWFLARGLSAAAVVVLPVAVIVLLLASLYRGMRSA
ncbi:MAG: hypothetical protein M0027_06395 [Candidatus Dormibacteraeota bacterium]|jgi:hypothetical protein|nr:hypothetical protein [Candidatus Dormibacteraeota bacterium]